MTQRRGLLVFVRTAHSAPCVAGARLRDRGRVRIRGRHRSRGGWCRVATMKPPSAAAEQARLHGGACSGTFRRRGTSNGPPHRFTRSSWGERSTGPMLGARLGAIHDHGVESRASAKVLVANPGQNFPCVTGHIPAPPRSPCAQRGRSAEGGDDVSSQVAEGGRSRAHSCAVHPQSRLTNGKAFAAHFGRFASLGSTLTEMRFRGSIVRDRLSAGYFRTCRWAALRSAATVLGGSEIPTEQFRTLTISYRGVDAQRN